MGVYDKASNAASQSPGKDVKLLQSQARLNPRTGVRPLPTRPLFYRLVSAVPLPLTICTTKFPDPGLRVCD